MKNDVIHLTTFFVYFGKVIFHYKWSFLLICNGFIIIFVNFK